MLAIASDSIVSVTAIAIAAISLVATLWIFRRQGDDSRQTALERKTTEYVDSLEHRVQDLEKQNERLTATQIEQGRELKDCQRARGELTEQNFRLYLRIDELEATVKRGGGLDI